MASTSIPRIVIPNIPPITNNFKNFTVPKNDRHTSVKLNTKALDKFMKMLGKGIVFKAGLFNKKQAFKGMELEYGNDSKNQPERPWLSQFVANGNPVQKRILKILDDFIRDTIAGKDDKLTTALAIQEEIQKGLENQEFLTVPLSPHTIAEKRAHGALYPEAVGIDTIEMLDAIKVKPVRLTANNKPEGM